MVLEPYRLYPSSVGRGGVMEVAAVLFCSGFCYCIVAAVVCFWANKVLTTTGFVLVLHQACWFYCLVRD